MKLVVRHESAHALDRAPLIAINLLIIDITATAPPAGPRHGSAKSEKSVITATLGDTKPKTATSATMRKARELEMHQPTHPPSAHHTAAVDIVTKTETETKTQSEPATARINLIEIKVEKENEKSERARREKKARN